MGVLEALQLLGILMPVAVKGMDLTLSTRTASMCTMALPLTRLMMLAHIRMGRATTVVRVRQRQVVSGHEPSQPLVRVC